MDEGKVFIHPEICRLCLLNPGVDDVLENSDLMQDIYLCTGIKVVPDDNFPRKICSSCLEIVLMAKQLRLLATENEVRMKAILINECNQFTNRTNNVTEDTMSNIGKLDDYQAMIHEDHNYDDTDVITIKMERSCSPKNDCTKKITVRKDLFETKEEMKPLHIDNLQAPKEEESQKNRGKKRKKEENITYTCAWCPKTFNAWKKVYCHQRLHNKNIQCPLDLCGKKFSTKGDLEKHIRTHTGERPYGCHICDRRFSQRCTLKSHMENVHQIETYS